MADTFDPSDEAQVSALLEHYAAQLHEHGFDSVRIFVTARDPDSTCQVHTAAAGQWYASFGAIDEWMTSERAKTAARMRAEIEGENKDDEAE